MYKTFLSSVSGAMIGPVACITAEGASVGAMVVTRGIRHAGTSSIEDEANMLAIHRFESVVGPHNNERTFRSTCKLHRAITGSVPLGATANAWCGDFLSVSKGRIRL